MKTQHALFICHQPLLQDLFSLNLKWYLGFEVCLCADPVQADSFYQKRNWDLVISLDRIVGRDMGKAIDEWRRVKASDHPIFILGKNSILSDTSDIITIEGNLNIKNFLQVIAKEMKVTAREMAQRKTSEFVSFPLRLIKANNPLTVTLFIRTNKEGQTAEYAPIGMPGQILGSKIEQYNKLGIGEIYIQSNDRLSLVNSLSTNILQTLKNRSGASTADQLGAAELGFELLAENLTQDGALKKEIMALSQECLETIDEIVEEVQSLGELMRGLKAQQSGNLYSHSIFCSFVATKTLDHLEWGAREHKNILNFVLFYHDIFLAPLYDRFPDVEVEHELLFHPGLTAEDKELVMNHALLAAEALKKYPRAPIGASSLILQHHGMSGGVGVALEYKDDLSPLAKVTLVCHMAVDLWMQNRSKPKKELMVMICGELKKTFPRATYREIIKAFSQVDLGS